MTDTPKPADPGAILLAHGMLPTPEEILAIDCTACKAKAGELCRPGNWICEVRVQEAIRIRRAAAAEPAERLFSSDEVRAAFRAAFHRSGEAFFPYPDMGADDEACEQATREGADSVVEALKRAAAAPEPIPFVASRPEVGESDVAAAHAFMWGRAYTDAEVRAAGLKPASLPTFESIEAFDVAGRGHIITVRLGRTSVDHLVNREVVIDGKHWHCRGVEGTSPMRAGEVVGLLVAEAIFGLPVVEAVQSEPPHPSPWRWTQDGEDLVSRLVDANGEVLIETSSFIGARLKALTERAQEIEGLLRADFDYLNLLSLPAGVLANMSPDNPAVKRAVAIRDLLARTPKEGA